MTNLVARRFTGYVPTMAGPCPACGQPSQYNLLPDVVVHDDLTADGRCAWTLAGRQFVALITDSYERLAAGQL